ATTADRPGSPPGPRRWRVDVPGTRISRGQPDDGRRHLGDDRPGRGRPRRRPDDRGGRETRV
ncbi:MAG: hypothetical protein AVDCRST_MAG60-311, partial [uncultured Nocardioides sp.]